jgi:hypothetical protein
VGYVPRGRTRQQHAYQASRRTTIDFRDAWSCKGTDPAACPLSGAPSPRHVQPEPGSRPRTCSTERDRWWTCAQPATVCVLPSTHQLHHPTDTSTFRPVRDLHGSVSAYATSIATRDEVVRVRSGSCISSTTCGTLWSSSAATVYMSWLRTDACAPGSWLPPCIAAVRGAVSGCSDEPIAAAVYEPGTFSPTWRTGVGHAGQPVGFFSLYYTGSGVPSPTLSGS